MGERGADKSSSTSEDGGGENSPSVGAWLSRATVLSFLGDRNLCFLGREAPKAAPEVVGLVWSRLFEANFLLATRIGRVNVFRDFGNSEKGSTDRLSSRTVDLLRVVGAGVRPIRAGLLEGLNSEKLESESSESAAEAPDDERSYFILVGVVL